MKFFLALALAAFVFAGCASHRKHKAEMEPARPVEPVKAPEPKAAQAWEYKMARVNDIEKELNQLASEGWKLVVYDWNSGTCILERPKH